MISTTHPDYSNTPASAARPKFDYVPSGPADNPQVTIVTPFYNTGAVFHETACCVLRQSFHNWEWLIVNDGSTDAEALAVLNQYRNRAPRIRVIEHEQNRGLPAARNTGFRQARSEYVVLLDSDDLLEPTALEKWIWYLESHPECSFVSGYSVGFGATEYLWSNGFHDGAAFLRQNMVTATSMIRRSVHQSIGGFDEQMRGGLEDWEFWLHCASEGYWGDTIPEHLDWYRRRSDHGDRWQELDQSAKARSTGLEIRNRYPRLQHSFPAVAYKPIEIYPRVPEAIPFENALRKEKRRLLMIIPWMTVGGADKFNLDLVSQLNTLGWETTIVATLEGDNCWLPEFAKQTPDIFILNHFLKVTDWPRFISYLIESRDIDNVLISNSDFAYTLLPYLRSRFPDLAFADYCHMEEEYWKGGGYARKAVEYQELFDMNIVNSEHLKQWMVRRGARADRIDVCYINVDTEKWKPSPGGRRRIRRELGLGDETPLILYAGRIHAQKQPRVFAATMLRLRDSGTAFVALVAGDGPEFKWLQGFVREHGLQGHVRLLGAVSNDRIKSLLQATDLFFLPSQMEGISLAIYEAMASGVAVVGADVGGQAELVTPDCGVLIPRNSETVEAELYAATLMDILSDRRKLRSMGDAGRRRVIEGFELRKMGLRMQELLRLASDWNRSRPQPAVNRGIAQSTLAVSIDYSRIEKLLQQVWPVYSWTQRNRPHLDLMFAGDKVPAVRGQTGIDQPAQEADPLARLQLMEDGIFNFFAHLPERVLQAYLDASMPRKSALLGDIHMMRRRVAPSIPRWQEQDSRIYIYGLGTHTQVLLATCPQLMPLIRGFIDRNAEEPFLGLPCVRPENITVGNADVIIYSSKRWETDMHRKLAHLATLEHVLLYSTVDVTPRSDELVLKPL
jgi:glycosyltransferase involved in cell wall biosynthesis